MSVKVKKKVDRRPELMRSLETAAGKALQHAATLCQGVARQLVSKRYQRVPNRRGRNKSQPAASEQQAEMQ